MENEKRQFVSKNREGGMMLGTYSKVLKGEENSYKISKAGTPAVQK